MRDKLNKFMQGRYGVDQFSRFILGVALFIIVVGSFVRRNAAGSILDTIGLILIIYTYFRILSRNVSSKDARIVWTALFLIMLSFFFVSLFIALCLLSFRTSHIKTQFFYSYFLRIKFSYDFTFIHNKDPV